MSTPEVQKFMLAKFGDTNLTPLDLMKIGEALLNTIAVTATLGHKSPSGSLDYSVHTGVMWADIVRDFTAWTSGRRAKAPGCEERLRSLMVEDGWQAHALEKVAQGLNLGESA